MNRSASPESPVPLALVQGAPRDTAISWIAAALPGLYLLLTSTTTLIPGIWPYDAKRILEFGLLLLLFLLPALNRRIRQEFAATLAIMPPWVGWTLLGVFGWGISSAVVNARSPLQLANSLSEVALLGSLVIAVCVVAACRRVGGRSFDRIAIGLIALTGLAVGLQELLGVAAAHAAGVDFNFRISLLHFSWPRFYNQVQSWTVPVMAALPLLFRRYSLARGLCVLVLALHWYVILATGARGSFVALSAAMLFAVLFLPPVRRPLLRWQLGGLALGALLFAGVLFSFEASTVSGPEVAARAIDAGEPAARGFYGNEDEGTSGFMAQSVGRPLLNPMGRTWMWRMALDDARHHPLLGIGPMNYVCTSPVRIGHPHSFPLQLAAEWGIPVALAVCVLFLALLWRTTMDLRQGRFADPDDATLAGLLLTGVLAAALHACLSGVMVMPASQVAGVLVCGLLFGLGAQRAPAKRSRAVISTVLICGLLAASGLLALGVHELRTMEQRSALLPPAERLFPRIWQDARVCRLYLPQNEVTN